MKTPAQELAGMFIGAIDMDRAVDALMACRDELWPGLQCELESGHPGDHRGTAIARDGSDQSVVEWEQS
jgi:hypothetical protein